MDVETVFAQTIHERQATSKRETPLAVCCLCGLLRDETRDSLDEERWVTRRTYCGRRMVWTLPSAVSLSPVVPDVHASEEN